MFAINQNTALTIIRANQIMASQISAFFRIVRHASYHLESHAEESILNHP
jgi:hypothetical protein